MKMNKNYYMNVWVKLLNFGGGGLVRKREMIVKEKWAEFRGGVIESSRGPGKSR